MDSRVERVWQTRTEEDWHTDLSVSREEIMTRKSTATMDKIVLILHVFHLFKNVLLTTFYSYCHFWNFHTRL